MLEVNLNRVMTYTLMLVVFVIGYAAIAFEHQLKLTKRQQP